MIVYIGSFSFPKNDAVAKRVFGIGLTLKSKYHVRFIGYSDNVAFNSISTDMTYDDFTYCSIHKPCNSMEHYLGNKDLKNIFDRLQKWDNEEKITHVIMTGTKSSFFSQAIISYLKKKKIKVVLEAMDWLKIDSGNFIFDIIKSLDIWYELNVLNMQADGIIAISSYFERYYQKRNKRTIVVPPISSYEIQETGNDGSRLKFVYAGFPCRMGKKLKNRSNAKDRLDIAIEKLFDAHKCQKDFLFNIVGMKAEDYITSFPEHAQLISELISCEKVKFWGRKSEAETKTIISQSDYSILLRDNSRMSNYGFPTKISESICLGIPVITTSTSDICKYLNNGYDSLIIDINQTERNEFEHIIERGKEYAIELKKNTFLNRFFCPETYQGSLTSFLNALN